MCTPSLQQVSKQGNRHIKALSGCCHIRLSMDVNYEDAMVVGDAINRVSTGSLWHDVQAARANNSSNPMGRWRFMPTKIGKKSILRLKRQSKIKPIYWLVYP